MAKSVKRTCNIKCASNCCYFPRPGHSVSAEEIKILAESIKNNIQSFEPQYRAFLQSIAQGGSFFVEKPLFGTYVKCDDRKPGFDSCMVPYYPCIFLTNAEKFENKNKLCMIHPHKFDDCKNTTPEYCMPGRH
jgi:hypothetical protein